MSGWRIEITTSGGFTGRGTGGVTIASDRAGSTLSRAVATARPATWRREYGASSPDAIHYTLRLARAGESFTTSWSELASAQLPEDLRTLFEAAWRAKD